MKRLFLIFVILLFSACQSGSPKAAEAFDEFIWETTFASDRELTQEDWQAPNPNPLPDGLEPGGDWFFDADRQTQITRAANYPGGAGGMGARFWKGPGTNQDSGTIELLFPAPQTELWIRWYMRYQEGFAWRDDEVHFKKNLYIYTGPRYTKKQYGYIVGVLDGYYTFSSYNPDGRATLISGTKWGDPFGRLTGDGEWHCYEAYLKMDTNGKNGVFRMWIDGALIMSQSDLDHSNRSLNARKGWDWFQFDSN